MHNLRTVMSESQSYKDFFRFEIQKVHEQKMEKSQQSQQTRQCRPARSSSNNPTLTNAFIILKLHLRPG